jgi:hypothetical protein
MTSRPADSAAPSPCRLTQEEIALSDALARRIERGSTIAVVPVVQADVGNRVLEATRELLDERGFPVAVIHGGADNAARAAWSTISLTRSEASKRNAIHPVVLVVKDAHLLPPGRLSLLVEVGNVAIVAVPAVRPAVPQQLALRQLLQVASFVVGLVLVSLAFGVFLFPVAHRGAPDISIAHVLAGTAAPVSTAPSAPAPPSPANESTVEESIGAPGLLIKARAGDTLEALYLRIYRGVTPPSFASVMALNPEHVRPGDILTFPAPVDGWSEQQGAKAGP